MLDAGKLSPITYSNVSTIGLRIKRFNEVKIFIEKNKAIISGKSKKAYYIFNKAKYQFETGQFSEVAALYNEQPIKEILLNVQMRILQLKAFYELSEQELCFSLLQSLDRQLNRKEVLAYHKEIFKNVVKTFKGLLTIGIHDLNALERFQIQIRETHPLTERDWFLKKVEVLLK